MAEGPGIVNASRNRRQGQQMGAPGFQAGIAIRDWIDPVGIEQAGRGGAFDQGDCLALRIAFQPGVDPAIGPIEPGFDIGAGCIAKRAKSDRLGHALLHDSHDVVVEHPVNHPHLRGFGGV